MLIGSFSRMQRIAILVTLCVEAIQVTLPAAALAELRTLEVVGTASIDPLRPASVAPRDAAIREALREAVIRVANDFLADQPIAKASGPQVGREPAGASDVDVPVHEFMGESGGVSGVPDSNGSDAKAPDLDALLGKKMVPYTSRFRVIEDRGRRPALFSNDPGIREEYMVIVEVQVDVDRVREKLLEAGLLRADENVVSSREIRLEIEGLTLYPAYLAMRRFLEGELGASGVHPVEMARGRTILAVETPTHAVEFLEQMLTLAPNEFKIVPLQANGNQVHILVHWGSHLAEASKMGLSSRSKPEDDHKSSLPR